MAKQATKLHYENALDQYGHQYADIMLDATAAVVEGEMDPEQLVTLDENNPLFGHRIDALDKQLSKLAQMYSLPFDQVKTDIQEYITKYVPEEIVNTAIDALIEEEFAV